MRTVLRITSLEEPYLLTAFSWPHGRPSILPHPLTSGLAETCFGWYDVSCYDVSRGLEGALAFFEVLVVPWEKRTLSNRWPLRLDHRLRPVEQTQELEPSLANPHPATESYQLYFRLQPKPELLRLTCKTVTGKIKDYMYTPLNLGAVCYATL